MYSQSEKVTQSTFKTFIASKEFALLKLSSYFSSGIEKETMKYLEGEYPGLVAFGSLERSSIRPTIWWTKHFGPIQAKLKMAEVKDGYYLFHRGEVVTWHSGSRDGTDFFKIALENALAPGMRLLNHIDPIIHQHTSST